MQDVSPVAGQNQTQAQDEVAALIAGYATAVSTELDPRSSARRKPC